jgi:AcrR family transcriptional regulator
LPRALLDAALTLIEREGAEALTLRAAARLAGVSQAAPYRHFENQEALLASVAEEGFRAMTAAMHQAAALHPSDPLGHFRALGLAYIEFATSHPAHFRVMFGRVAPDCSAHPGLREAAEESYGLLLRGIRDCQAAGMARQGDPEELALCAWSAVHGLAALAVDGRLQDCGRKMVDLAGAITANVYLGLGPR